MARIFATTEDALAFDPRLVRIHEAERAVIAAALAAREGYRGVAIHPEGRALWAKIDALKKEMEG